jgi:hypothetical protein
MATFLAMWQLPGIIERATHQWLAGEFPSQPGLASLCADVTGQVARNLFTGLVWPAAVTLVAGCFLLATLLIWERRKTHSQEERPAGAED